MVSALPWAVYPTEDALAFSLCFLYPLGIMVWAFFDEDSSVGALFWPIILIGIPILFAVFFAEELYNKLLIKYKENNYENKIKTDGDS